MLLDGFTVFAQIVNFLILVFILKKFLYKPITDAMAQRQAKVQSLLAQANEQMAIAQQEKATYQQQQQQLLEQKETLMAQARAEAEAYKQDLFDQAETDVSLAQQRWRKGLEQDQHNVAQQLQQQLSHTLTQTVRQILTDLTNTSLEMQLADVFLERLHHLSATDRDRLQAAVSQHPDLPVTIAASFPLAPEMRKNLTHQVQHQLGAPTPIKFEHLSNGACNMELRVAGYRLTWGVTPYLNQLQMELAQTLQAVHIP
jgi:F-type H+-transporting ATPase subunit b